MTSERMYTRDDLLNHRPRHDSFVGIDSDGCVFPTMEIKQKRCFHPEIVAHWKLEAIEKYVRQAAEFVNLYSKWRGENRFPALVRTLDLVREREEVVASGVKVPMLNDLRAFIASGAPLGNPGLEKAARETGSEELATVLRWTHAVNAAIERTVKDVGPFRWVRESLDRIAASSDAICVSQTPTEALVREWDEHGMTKYVAIIAGQELGTKAEHIGLATKGRYESSRILMIGDAPGDKRAAKANQAFFFPINPGHEEASWDRFCHEAYARFLAGTYGGAYEAQLIAEFDALLPEKPSW
jgi:phosphoglycolate phosphatase-like HAD superfamily hydrolase